MPLDGVVIRSICTELDEILSGSRIEKVFQPEKDEIILNIRTRTDNLRLLLNASSNYPRIHITEAQKDNPQVPPNFCMLLRKHLSGGRIKNVQQHDFERIIEISFESFDELGDSTIKKLIIEIMGRHSNIMLVDANGIIIDSIKHIDDELSRVREVLPGRAYIYPPSQQKVSPDKVDLVHMHGTYAFPNAHAEKFLLDTLMGFSPFICREICHRAGIDAETPVSKLSSADIIKLQQEIDHLISDIENKTFFPCIAVGSDNRPADFYCFKTAYHSSYSFIPLENMNEALDSFYTLKDRSEKLKVKKSGLEKSIIAAIDKCTKKISAQEDKLLEVSDFENLKIFGDLIFSNIHSIQPGQKKALVYNYYDAAEENHPLPQIEIPLDENLTPQQNANRYYKKYNKAKNTMAAASEQIEKLSAELEYLESVLTLLQNCENIEETEEIQKELQEQGIINPKQKVQSKKKEKPSSPMQFMSSDGFMILVGKNNRQNDSLTIGGSNREDIWFHAQKIPGSHVVIRAANREVPDSTLLEAATLAAYYSKARNSGNVPVDYTRIKNVKKPPGAKPGMVIYSNFKTLIVRPGPLKHEHLGDITDTS